jgi:hypothetical protein
MTRVAEVMRLPIAFRAAGGSTVHAPLIAASVAGVDTLLVLDTGSDVPDADPAGMVTWQLAGAS